MNILINEYTDLTLLAHINSDFNNVLFKYLEE